MADGQVIFEIDGDASKVKKSFNDVTSALDKESKKWDRTAQESSDTIGNKFTGMFKKISTVAAAAKVAQVLYDWGKAAVSAASDLEEVQNVVDVTFGEGAAQIQSWADTARKQFGLTETQAKRFTSTLGAMMKSAGLAGPEIISMSTDLAGLAADMASFYNLDFDTAFQKIRSGISGETEPLKQLGINMSVANLQAYALTQGITKAFDKMSQSEQTMLRYQYLMQATADAQGDFARTSDGYANSLRLLETNMESLKTNVGTLLLPAINTVVGAINGLFDALDPSNHSTVLDDFANIDLNTESKIAQIQETAAEAYALIGALEEISGAGDVKTGLTSFVSTLADDFGDLGGALATAKEGDYAGTIKAISEAMAAQTGGSAAAWETLLKAVADNLPGATTAAMTDDEKTAAFLKAAGDAAASLGGTYPELWQTFLGVLGDDAGPALSALAEASTGVSTMEAIASASGKVTKASSENWSALLTALSKTDGLSGFFGDANSASNTIASFANSLGSVGPERARGWNELLTTLSEHAGDLTELTGKSVEETQAWLAGLAESANSLDPEKADGWDTLFNALIEGLPGLGNTDEGRKFLESISGLYDGVGVSANDAASYLEALGFETEGIADKQRVWLAVCDQLVKKIPGLSSIINTNTGEVDGGTKALTDYVDAWEKLQTKGIILDSLNAKKDTLKTAFGDWEGLRAQMLALEALRDWRLRKYNEAGGDTRYNELDAGNLSALRLSPELDKEAEALRALREEYWKAELSYRDSVEGFRKVDEPYQAALADIKEMEEAAKASTDGIEGLTEATNKLAVSNDEAANRLDAFASALKDVNDYYQTMRDETARTVSQTISGFGNIVTPVQKAKQEINDLNKQLEEAGADGKEINLKINALEEGVPTAQNMRMGLESQVEYMNTYLENLKQARRLGVSEDLLASLSSGSQEDYDYLAALAQASGPEVEQINAAYEEMQKTREEFTTALTNEKLTADEAFGGLVETLQNTLGELDMADGAKSAMYATVEGIANGIAEASSDLQTQVDGVIAQIERLNEVTGSSATFRVGRFALSLGGKINSHASGLDFVPFDNYLAQLHEGESVLTAEEARIWRDFKAGGVSSRNSIDYNALSGAIWDNAPSMGGGNVYLNGQAVGRVINAAQADSLRNLERSGWQG